MIAPTAGVLGEVTELIKTLVTAAAVVHFDETPLNVGGRYHWLHVAATAKLTAYLVHPSRGRAAVTAFGVLPHFEGVAVHDALPLYNAYYRASHALCGAHIARELAAEHEADPAAIWPTQALDALTDLNNAAHRARQHGLDQIPPDLNRQLVGNFRHAVRCGLASHPRRPSRKQTKTRNLLERLRDREAQILRYTYDLRVPFTNNQAERDLRMCKLQTKISGCLRTPASAQAWARIRSYISTAHKHGINILQALHDAITGNPWTPPSHATT